jgi:tetratricopeptide (TPR) repeat protein
MARECNLLSVKTDRKAARKKFVRIGLIILFIAFLLIGASTSHAKYYLANAYSFTGSYNQAIKMYKKLGPYKDSKERLLECQYLNGTELEEKGDYQGAEKAFAAAGNYRDSKVKKVEMEKLIIKNGTIGSLVSIGKNDWMILDFAGGKALLMKNKALPEMPYNDSPGDITWEKSTLRQWLNSEYLDKTFSEAERNQIVLADIKNDDNANYKTDGGNDTQDYIFLLSMEEADKYQSVFPKFKSNSWLRSPGSSQNSAAFLSVKGVVMDYGYTVASEDFKVRPVMWFDYE